MIPVASPVLSGNEKLYVNECLDTTWISSAGRFIAEFERSFAKTCGVKHAIATNNGTTALHLALTALGIGPGDEVVVPVLTYIATANAVRYCGAEPVFVDVEPDSMNMDPAKFEAAITERTRAVIPVDLYGNPANMTAREISTRRRAYLPAVWCARTPTRVPWCASTSRSSSASPTAADGRRCAGPRPSITSTSRPRSASTTSTPRSTTTRAWPAPRSTATRRAPPAPRS